jgi:hypothetical protein
VTTACPSCGSPVEATDAFCGRCGTRLGTEAPAQAEGSRFCRRCGGPLSEDARFCGRCGAPARETIAAEETAASPAGPSQVDEEQDFFADWNRVFSEEPAPSPHSEVTEAIARPPPPAEPDTAVIAPVPEPEPGPAPPPPRERAPSPPRPFPWGATLALLGAMAVVVSAILPWRGDDGLPRDIPARVLIDPNAPAAGLNLGIVLLVVGTLGALVALLTMVSPRLGWIRRLVGLATLAISGVFLFQLWGDRGDADIAAFVGLIGTGVIAAVGGALIQLFAPSSPRG